MPTRDEVVSAIREGSNALYIIRHGPSGRLFRTSDFVTMTELIDHHGRPGDGRMAVLADLIFALSGRVDLRFRGPNNTWPRLETPEQIFGTGETIIDHFGAIVG